MSRTYRDRPRRLVRRTPGARDSSPIPGRTGRFHATVEVAAYAHSIKSRRHIPLRHRDDVNDDYGPTRVKAALARAGRDYGPGLGRLARLSAASALVRLSPFRDAWLRWNRKKE